MSWDFSIDVGGTFTDVVARGPDGRTRTLKLLSTGVFKGVVGAAWERGFSDPARAGDPGRFWLGAELTTAEAAGPIALATLRPKAFACPAPAQGAGRPDRPHGEPEALRRLRHLGCYTAPGGHAHVRQHRDDRLRRRTPIMKVANLALVGDLFAVIPAVIEELRKLEAGATE